MRNKFACILILSFITIHAFSQLEQSVQNDLKNFVSSQSGRLYTGGSLPQFMISQGTVGTRYLFDHWGKGTVTNTQGITFNAPNVAYNFDKVMEKLVVLVDSSTVIELNSPDVSTFTIGDSEMRYTFERMKNSTDLSFYQPVMKVDNGYSLYKHVTTKFKKADYKTNGLIESGNKYDEYKEETEYYILSPKKELIALPLKEKGIKKAMEEIPVNTYPYLSSHQGDKIDEDYFQSLVEFINSKKK